MTSARSLHCSAELPIQPPQRSERISKSSKMDVVKGLHQHSKKFVESVKSAINSKLTTPIRRRFQQHAGAADGDGGRREGPRVRKLRIAEWAKEVSTNTISESRDRLPPENSTAEDYELPPPTETITQNKNRLSVKPPEDIEDFRKQWRAAGRAPCRFKEAGTCGCTPDMTWCHI